MAHENGGFHVKGIAPIIIAVILIAGAISGGVAYKEYQNIQYEKYKAVSASDNHFGINVQPMQTYSNAVVIPDGTIPDAPSEITGSRYNIKCDRTVYDIFIEGYITCEYTNLDSEPRTVDTSLLSDNENFKILSTEVMVQNVPHTITRYREELVPHHEVLPPSPEDGNETETIIDWIETVQVPYTIIEKYPDYVPITTSILIASGETKQIRFKIHINEWTMNPIKFDAVADDGSVSDSLDPWYYSGWTKRISAVIDNTATNQNLTLYPVRINMTYDADMMTDFADVRWSWYNTTDSTEYPCHFWIEEEFNRSSAAVFWVEVPDIRKTNTETLYMYYGKAGSANASNGTQTFSFFDDFNNDTAGTTTTMDTTSLWTITSTGWYLRNNGTLYLRALAAQDVYFVTKYTFPIKQNFTVMSRSNLTAYGNNARFLAITNHLQGFLYNAGGFLDSFYYTAGAFVDASYKMDGTWNILSIQKTDDDNAGLASILPRQNNIPVLASVAGKEVISTTCNFEAGGGGVTNEQSMTWFLVRNSTTNEPYLTSWGAEEDAPASINYFSANPSYNDTTIYEANLTSYYINLTTTDNAIQNVIGDLIFNGTNKTNSTDFLVHDNSTTTTHWFRFNFTTNLSQYSDYTTLTNTLFNFSINYTNGTLLVNQTAYLSQVLRWSYTFENLTASPNPSQAGTSVLLDADLFKYNTKATLSDIKLYHNNTTYSPSVSGTNYYYTVTAPTVSESGSIYYNFSMNATWNGTSFMRTNITYHTVSPVNLTDCSAGGITVLRFEHFDEESLLALNHSMELSLTLHGTSGNYNMSYPLNLTHSVCMSPNTSTALIDIFASYNNATSSVYPIRYYIRYAVNVSNTTTIIPIYSLNSSFADDIVFTVEDNMGVKLTDKLVLAKRYYPASNSYRYVDSGLTDVNGETMLKLRGNDVYHVMEVYTEDTLEQQFDRMIITANEVLLTVIRGEASEYWKLYNKVSYSCTNSTAAWTITCDYSMLDDTTQDWELYVKEYRATTTIEVCNETAHNSHGSLTCSVGSTWSGRELQYTFKVISGGANKILVTQGIKDVFNSQFGKYGLLFMIVLLTAMVFAALSLGVAGASVVTGIGILIGVSLNLITISGAAISGILLVLLIFVVRER